MTNTEWPKVLPSGEKVWACCVSSIGPKCRHQTASCGPCYRGQHSSCSKSSVFPCECATCV